MLSSAKIDLSKALDLIINLVETLNLINVALPKTYSTEKNNSLKISKYLFRSGIFRIYILYPILDIMLIELMQRFSNDHVLVFNRIRCLNPEKKNFCNEEDLFSFPKSYGADIRDITHEKYRVKRLIERENEEGTESTKSVLQL